MSSSVDLTASLCSIFISLSPWVPRTLLVTLTWKTFGRWSPLHAGNTLSLVRAHKTPPLYLAITMWNLSKWLISSCSAIFPTSYFHNIRYKNWGCFLISILICTCVLKDLWNIISHGLNTIPIQSQVQIPESVLNFGSCVDLGSRVSQNK